MNAFSTSGPSLASTDEDLRRSASHNAASRRSTRKQTTVPRRVGNAVLRPIDYGKTIKVYTKA